MAGNVLYYGDNLAVLRAEIKDESIDLVYLDPPFNSQATYNVLFKAVTGEQSHAQIEAFEDTWHWSESAERAFDEVMNSGNTDAAELLRAMRAFLKENDMMAYLTMLAIRLIELRRVLKSTGSLYLHCDPTASHYLKLLLDAIFEPQNFRNEIVWKRTSAHSSARRYGPVHDVLLLYSRSDDYVWNDQFQPYDPEYIEVFFEQREANGRRWKRMDLTGAGIRHGETGETWRGINITAKGRHWAYPPSVLEKLDAAGKVHWPKAKDGMPRLKQYLDEMSGVPLQDVWTDIRPLHNLAEERLGYATQKPVALLERIIRSSSNEGDVVLDPFCGCGTAVHAAQKLKRKWIGIDITHLAISLIEKRLNDAFPGITYTVHGTPKDLDGARDLAARDKYQFQWWAVSLVNAVPFGGRKKGADTGIDGIIYFKDFVNGKAATEKVIVSVKGGETVSVPMVRDLCAVVERERAKMGLFVTLAEPTDPMKKEALKAGFAEVANGKFRKIQIVTVADLLDGKKPDLPSQDPNAFLQAPREEAEQLRLEGLSPAVAAKEPSRKRRRR
jgi:DNA modification methylase